MWIGPVPIQSGMRRGWKTLVALGESLEIGPATIVSPAVNALANCGSNLALPQMIGYLTHKYPVCDLVAVILTLAWFEDAETEADPISLNAAT
jgi:hypothetical protein